MFRQLFIRVLGFSAAAFILLASPQVFAQQGTVTAKQIEVIRQNCLDAQVSMQRLQYSDAAARINRGSSYEAIVSKLVAPFNSRAALNRLQATPQLLDITNRLERTFTDFKKHYTAYEESLSAALALKCQDQPVTFYDRLGDTRAMRQQLATDITQLSRLFAEYQKAIESITKTVAKADSAQ